MEQFWGKKMLCSKTKHRLSFQEYDDPKTYSQGYNGNV